MEAARRPRAHSLNGTSGVTKELKEIKGRRLSLSSFLFSELHCFQNVGDIGIIASYIVGVSVTDNALLINHECVIVQFLYDDLKLLFL